MLTALLERPDKEILDKSMRSTRTRANPLALAVLATLKNRPMHPYEVANTLRRGNEHLNVWRNYGSLYFQVASLAKRGLDLPQGDDPSGSASRATIYALTAEGETELHEWLVELILTPVHDLGALEIGLSFATSLPPDECLQLLRKRQERLELDVAEAEAHAEIQRAGPQLRAFSLGEELHSTQRRSELPLPAPPHRRDRVWIP